MNILFFTKPKEHTLDCVKFLVEVGATICGIVIYHKEDYLETEFMRFCCSKKIAIYDGEDIYNHIEEFEGKLDVVFCNTYPKLINKAIVDIAKIGGYNFHAAPLPEYKGVFGFNFAIYNGERQYGVTCHELTEKFDDGNIVEVMRFDIDPENITVKELVSKSEKQLFILFKKIFFLLASESVLESIPQTNGTYYSRNQFEKIKRINETDSQIEIERKIRAFWYPPYEGAYILLDGKKYTIVDEKMLLRIKNDE